jgi:hypothetical protein
MEQEPSNCPRAGASGELSCLLDPVGEEFVDRELCLHEVSQFII